MPIYEYLCNGCGYQFEVKQKFSDPPIEVCEKCGKDVRKLISAPGIMFKGTGWYITDYSTKLKDPQAAKPDGKEKPAEKSEAPSGEKGASASSKESSPSTAKSEASSPASSPSAPPSSSSS
ncbi:MAG: zinc ribbon domain-containing protein [Nitrospirae bacterium]|nr:MAG: zinc ribbon domain-containing protein [Nitrospirota bacterium]